MRAKGSHLFFLRSKYQTDDGGVKSYDVVSRDPKYNPNRSRKDPDAVAIFVLNKDHSQMLITHEFRYPVNGWTISTPAGLIDPGERPIETAKRELQEETGYTTVLDAKALPATYSSVGMSDEKVQPVILVIDETKHIDQDLGSGEVIKHQWVSKDEAKTIATTATNLTARAQLALLLFANDALIQRRPNLCVSL